MDPVNTLDLYLLHLINAPAGERAGLDTAINMLRDAPLLKAGPLVLLWWALWFARGTDQAARARLLAVLVVSVPAIAIGRMLALTLPFRLRPVHEPGLEINVPIGMPEQLLSGWSAMPSDHAVMFLSIAVGMIFVSRGAGWLAVGYALIFICLPRIYSGLHYPSDIVVGALAGALVAIALMPVLTRFLGRITYARLSLPRQATLYAVTLTVSLQIATMFEAPRFLLAQFGLN